MSATRTADRRDRVVPRELVAALRSVPGAVEAWLRTPARLRRVYIRHVAEAWTQPARQHRAHKTACWAASGELAFLVHRVDWRDPIRPLGPDPS